MHVTEGSEADVLRGEQKALKRPLDPSWNNLEFLKEKAIVMLALFIDWKTREPWPFKIEIQPILNS